MITSMKRYSIVSEDGKTQATIVPERGAFVSSLILPFPSGSRETLFLHDYAWQTELDDLPGGIPFLFPVCARLSRNEEEGAYLYDGKLYRLKIHGFSWFETWSVTQVTQHSIEVTLRDNANTFSYYPFHFCITLKFTVFNERLECHQTYQNNEKQKSMPYYAGFHPYFLTPDIGQGKEKVILQCHPVRQLQYNATLTDIVGEKPILKTPVVITDHSINEQLLVLGDDKLITLTFPSGDVLKINAHGIQDPNMFSYLQLYTIPNKPFFCTEPWMSFPNAMNTVSGVRFLKPGQQEEAVFQVFV